MDIKGVRSSIPALNGRIFLNHAAVSPMPIKAAESMKNFLNDKVRARLTYNVNLEHWMEKARDSKRFFSRLIGATEDEIALIPNTTFGLNLIAHMLPYKPGSNVVTNTLEYTSNVIAWLKLRELGVEVRIIRDVNGRISLEGFEKNVDERTVAVAVGQVGWFNGFRHNLKAISEFAHDRGAFLVVDGIQAVGNMKIDVVRDGIDFLACGSYKWLMGPQNAGFLYIKKDLIDELNPPFLGENSIDPGMVKRSIYERFDLFDLKYSKGIGKYEVVHIDDVAYVGASESMHLILDFGIERVEERIKRIDEYLVEGLLERGLELQTPVGEGEYHAIINFKVKDADKVMEFLSRSNIVVSKRVGGIRVSPHFYNTEEEIDIFLNILEKASGTEML